MTDDLGIQVSVQVFVGVKPLFSQPPPLRSSLLSSLPANGPLFPIILSFAASVVVYCAIKRASFTGTSKLQTSSPGREDC